MIKYIVVLLLIVICIGATAQDLPEVYQSRITQIVESYQRLDPQMQGAIYYTIKVLPNGFVEDVTMDSSDVYHQAMEDRVGRVFRQAQMPKTEKGFVFRYMVFLRKGK